MARLLVVLILGSGCAFGIDAPDPDRPRSKPPQCDTGKGAVVLDSAMAAVAAIVAVSVMEEEPAVALVPLGIGALYLGGAIAGNRNANKCREAMNDFESYLAARETLDDEARARAMRRDDPAPAPGPIAATAPIAAPAPAAQAPAAPPAITATPAPAPVSAAAAAAPAPASKPAPTKPEPPDADDEWREFWREVP